LEVNYVDYTDYLLETAIEAQEPKVYLVVDNYQKQAVKQEYQAPLLAQGSLFLTRKELKEKLFLPERIVLKEEKRVLIFYEVLTDKDKEQLGIESYFDALELANDFFNFYDQLQEYEVTKIDKLAAWQQERYERLQSIRARYEAALEKRGYTDRTLANAFANFSLQFISDYSEVVVVNILDLTPLEKKMLQKIEAAGKEVTLYCQVDSSDFNEQDLTLESVTLPANLQPEVEIYETTDQLLEVINCLAQLETRPEEYEILAADAQSSNYDHLLSRERFNLNKKYSFKRTKLYRFLAGLHTLLTSSDQSQGELKLSLKQLREVSCRQAFKDYYGLGSGQISQLNQLAQRGYVYLSAELIREQEQTEVLGPFSQLLSDIEELSQLTDLAAFITWLTDLELDPLLSEEFTADVNKYFESLSELDIIAELKIADSWADYFADTAAGLFNLILRHLRYKKLTPDLSEAEAKIDFHDLLDVSCQPRGNVILLNITEGIIPTSEGAEFLLTDQQRRELNLSSTADRRLREEYKFFRSILGAEKVIIFTRRNEEQNTTPSSFVERLRLAYDLSRQEAPFGEADYDLIMRELFSTSKVEIDSGAEGVPELELPVADSDFEFDHLSLGFYKYSILQDCPCRFYFEHLVHLEPEWEPIEKKLNKRILGSLVHNIFEAVVANIQPQLKAGIFDIQEEQIKQIIEQELIKQRLKIPKYYANYYQKVLFPAVQEAVTEFLDQLTEKLTGEITAVLAEWEPERTAFLQHSRADVLLSGRIDLVIKTAEQNYLIDYKTGSGSEEQLDFYSLLFNSEAAVLDRSIYNVMSQKFTQSKTDPAVEFRAELREEVTNLLASEEYQPAAGYQCRNCDYRAVCRVVAE